MIVPMMMALSAAEMMAMDFFGGGDISVHVSDNGKAAVRNTMPHDTRNKHDRATIFWATFCLAVAVTVKKFSLKKQTKTQDLFFFGMAQSIQVAWS